jgi:ferrous iron transport protein B
MISTSAILQASNCSPEPTCVLVIGRESVGKSQLVSSLTGRWAESAGFRGTTVACETYAGDGLLFVDTPGIVVDADTVAVGEVLLRLRDADRVLAVVSAAHLDEDLRVLLPLVRGKLGAVVVTFWDKVSEPVSRVQVLRQLEAELGVPFVPVDARHVSGEDASAIATGLRREDRFSSRPPTTCAGWEIVPRNTVFDLPVLGQLLALVTLVGPAWLAVRSANQLADALNQGVSDLIAPMLAAVNAWPGPLAHYLGGNYGMVAMGPFLLLYALPTVLAFAAILAVYKASGLVDRLTTVLDPLVSRVGLSGRDLVRVIMGFGCNVPAVVNTRCCATSTRGRTIAAISFGAACSYQLPATLSVFSAAKMQSLGAAYLLALVVTTIIYLRISAGRRCHVARVPSHARRDFMEWPRPMAVLREIRAVLWQFLGRALPVFLVICLLAATLEWLGALDLMGRVLAPLMRLFDLPANVAPAIVLASIRKDGILLLARSPELASMTQVQVLTAVYLAGSLLPCAVTLLAIAREMRGRFVVRLVLRQVLAAVVFSAIMAHVGAWLLR